MKCAQARGLFGACWDDEITQAEREALEAHFAACPGCRAEYDEYSRALELVGDLPRVEPSPNLVERVMARARRVSPALDRVGIPGIPWVPVTAAAALLAVAVTLVSPWIVPRPASILPVARNDAGPVRQPELRAPAPSTSPTTVAARGMPEQVGALRETGVDPLASMPDSLFDHSEDVEFILDPMTLRRGRPAALRLRPAVQGQQATITF